MSHTLTKPALLPVFPPHAEPGGDCLLARLLTEQPWRKDVSWPPGFEGGIAHRLDNATSGAVLVADDVAELARWRELFHEHRLTKTYLLLAAYDVPWRRRTCTAAIAHHPRKKSLMVVQRSDRTAHRGRWYPATTTFRHLRDRLWEATMTTGVTHQIRAHAGFLGIPIRGDKHYGGGNEPMFHLHHVGLIGPGGVHTDPVPAPAWADQV